MKNKLKTFGLGLLVMLSLIGIVFAMTRYAELLFVCLITVMSLCITYSVGGLCDILIEEFKTQRHRDKDAVHLNPTEKQKKEKKDNDTTRRKVLRSTQNKRVSKEAIKFEKDAKSAKLSKGSRP
jgi:hypothetical protein